MSLSITSRSVADVVVLDMSGRLSVLERGLQQRVIAHLGEGHRSFVLNMTTLTHVDSDGLGQLVSIWTSIRKTGGGLTLLRPGERVRELLKITRLHTVFEVFDDEAQAIRRAQAHNLSSRFATPAALGNAESLPARLSSNP